jgi:hypothetical protein
MVTAEIFSVVTQILVGSLCEVSMSLTAILAVIILSCDFLLYFFFRYVYAEKPTTRSRRVHSHRHHQRAPQPRTTISRDNSHRPPPVSFPDPKMRLRTGYF